MSTSVGEVEERSVELAEVKAGVQLLAGRPVVLIVNGVQGRRRSARSSNAPGEAGAGLTPGTVGGVKDGKYAIEMQLHAAGGTPLAHERVRIYDPDTGEPVGDPAVTDENGVLKARVPAEKEYQIHIDADPPEEHPDAFGDHEHPLAGQLPHPDEHAVLHVAFVDVNNAPLKGEAVKVKDEDGNSQDLSTGDRGNIDLVVEHGVYTVEMRGSTFVAHSVFSGELEGEGAPYRFVVPS